MSGGESPCTGLLPHVLLWPRRPGPANANPVRLATRKTLVRRCVLFSAWRRCGSRGAKASSCCCYKGKSLIWKENAITPQRLLICVNLTGNSRQAGNAAPARRHELPALVEWIASARMLEGLPESPEMRSMREALQKEIGRGTVPTITRSKSFGAQPWSDRA